MSKKEERFLMERDKTVVKANALIQKSRFSLTVQQQRVILYLISKIDYNDSDFKEYEFSLLEFMRVCGLERNGKGYKELKDCIKEIADKSLWITLDDGNRETLLRWIEKPTIYNREGIIRIRLDNDMKPYLLQLKHNFTSYELIYTLMMKSKYSIRLYELIKSIHYHELEEYKRQYAIEELRILLDAEKYTEYRNFNQRVLKPAVEEINRYTDKIVSYEAITRARKTVAIEFTIKSKDSLQCARLRSEIDKELGTDQLTLWDELLMKGYVSENDGE